MLRGWRDWTATTGTGFFSHALGVDVFSLFYEKKSELSRERDKAITRLPERHLLTGRQGFRAGPELSRDLLFSFSFLGCYVRGVSSRVAVAWTEGAR